MCPPDVVFAFHSLCNRVHGCIACHDHAIEHVLVCGLPRMKKHWQHPESRLAEEYDAVDLQ